MKKIAIFSLIVVAAALSVAPLAEASGRRHFGGHRPAFHSRVFIGVGPAYYWGPYPYWYYPPPPYVVYAPPPVVVREDPPVYLQQPAPPPAPAPAPSTSSAEGYWYYCQSAGAYYPNVSSCPEAWVKVAPR